MDQTTVVTCRYLMRHLGDWCVHSSRAKVNNWPCNKYKVKGLVEKKLPSKINKFDKNLWPITLKLSEEISVSTINRGWTNRFSELIWFSKHLKKRISLVLLVVTLILSSFNIYEACPLREYFESGDILTVKQILTLFKTSFLLFP